MRVTPFSGKITDELDVARRTGCSTVRRLQCPPRCDTIGHAPRRTSREETA